MSTNHRDRRFRNRSGKVRRAVRIARSSSWLIIYPPRAKDSSMSLGHIADDTYLRPVARSKIATPRPPNRVFLHASRLWHSSTPNACSLSHSPSAPPPSFTQSPYPPRSLVRDEQTHPHSSRFVVSHSTCPPLSSPPHANSFVIGPAVIKHTRGSGDRSGSRNLESMKHTHTRESWSVIGEDRRRSGPSCVLPKGVPQGQTESGGIVLAAICWAPSAQRWCHPEEAMYLLTFSHLFDCQ